VKSCIRTRAGRKAISRSLRRADVVGRDRALVLEAEQVFEQHLQRKRQAGDAGKAVSFSGRKAVVVVLDATNGELAQRLEAIQRGHVALSPGCSFRRQNTARQAVQTTGNGLGTAAL
jgi:hypothetical protein